MAVRQGDLLSTLAVGHHRAELAHSETLGAFSAPIVHRAHWVRIRAEIAKGGRAGDVFLPDRLAPKLERLWAYEVERGEALALAEASRTGAGVGVLTPDRARSIAGRLATGVPMPPA